MCGGSIISGNIPHGQMYIRNFVIYRILGQPEVDVEKWKLTIEGLVRKKSLNTHIMNYSAWNVLDLSLISTASRVGV